MKRAIFLLLLAAASPAAAQDHSGHAPPPAETAPESSDEGQPSGEEAMDHSQMDHSQMDHGEMDHSAMDHGDTDQPSMQAMGQDIPEGPPPPEAFEGPAYAADLYLDPAAMAASRAAVAREVSGGGPLFWVQGDRAEYRTREGSDGYLWDVQGFYGGDLDKFWFKSEGEGSFGEKPESAEVQALWSHAIGPWFDVQAGVRQDLVGPERTHAVVGVQGLAPYLFEVDAAAFLSDEGDLTARVEGELDQRITQRLILQPRAEINLAAQDIPELGIGAGVDRIEAGIRLRYEFAREFAPYIGVEQEWRLGQSADYARAGGEDPSMTNFVAGIRFWF